MTFNANSPTTSGMTLTFDDEFNTNSLSDDNAVSGTNWSNHIWYDGANPGAGTVANGVLSLNSGADMSSVDSAGQGFAQKYGYFEIDMKVPSGVGTWPAFWMMSQQHMANGANPASEIDVIEGQGNYPNGYYTTLHSNTGSGSDQVNPMPNATGDLGAGDLSNGYHRFGVLWSPDSNQLTYYFDGQAIGTSTKYSTTDYSPDALLIDNWVGDIGWGGNAPGDARGALQVDYVRAYQFTSEDPSAVVAQAVSPAAGQTDPTALASATGGAEQAASGSSMPSASGAGTGLQLQVSGDMYNGDPQITVTVDGQNAGTYDISAHHSQGQVQTIDVAGNYDPTVAHQVAITFTNDAWDGAVANTDGHDRNAYVEQVSLNGESVAGQNFASNTASLGSDGLDPHAAVMLGNGTASYNLAANPAAVSSGQTASTGLQLQVSGDMYNGDPEITVTVDGQNAGTYDISAHHSLGQVQTIDVAGNYDPTTAHQIAITFTNDAWDGAVANTDGHDRNVYVEQVTLNGESIAGQNFTGNNASLGSDGLDSHAAVMLGNGTAIYNIAAAPASTPGNLAPAFTEGTHNVFTVASAALNAQIANFDPTQDVLDLAPALKAAGYTGSDPIGDHVVTLTQTATGSTAVMIDPTGQAADHGTTAVTLDHVLPQNVPASDLWH